MWNEALTCIAFESPRVGNFEIRGTLGSFPGDGTTNDFAETTIDIFVSEGEGNILIPVKPWVELNRAERVHNVCSNTFHPPDLILLPQTHHLMSTDHSRQVR